MVSIPERTITKWCALSISENRLRDLRRARAFVTSDPDIMGGTPVIRGTRITAQAILGRISAGDSIASILEDYPYLDQETVEAAALYAKANPPHEGATALLHIVGQD